MPTTDGPSPTNRRTTPRFSTHGRIVGQIVARDLPVRVREIGLGGFSIETMEPLETGETHAVRLTTDDDWSAVVTARAAYTHPSCAADGSPIFVTGFAFPPSSPSHDERAVRYMIEKITSLPM